PAPLSLPLPLSLSHSLTPYLFLSLLSSKSTLQQRCLISPLCFFHSLVLFLFSRLLFSLFLSSPLLSFPLVSRPLLSSPPFLSSPLSSPPLPPFPSLLLSTPRLI